jgi:release factor glutamine methyltransferase
MTRGQALEKGAERLRRAGIARPRLEARLLLAGALGLSAEAVLCTPEAPADVEKYETLVERRAGREPLALLLGRREFWSLDFAVSNATLIPRPDSETLIEAAVEAFTAEPPKSILDLGTGTGCLLLAALHEFPDAHGIGVDRSPEAIALAQRNAAMLGLNDRAAFLVGNWGAAVRGQFDVILSNPPYIPASDIPGLMPDVAGFEPRSALDGGSDGLDAYRSIIPGIPALLTGGGCAVLELGRGQAEPVTALANAAGLTTYPRRDLTGIVRALLMRNALP